MDAMGKTSVIILLLLSLTAFSQENSNLVIKGNELYKKGDFKNAAEQYKLATERDPADPIAPFNLGNALRKLNQLDAAEKSYAVAAERSKAKLQKSAATYNDGVAFTRQQKLEESINAYKQSLRLNPADQQARENLQLALNQLKKKSSGGGGGNNNDKNDQKNNQPQPKNNSKLNEKQAEQMLGALREDEKKLQQNIQKKNNSNSGSNRKDW